MTEELNTTPSSKNSLADRFDAAVVLYKAEKYGEAVVAFEKILKKKVFKEACIDASLCYRELRDLENAKKWLHISRFAPYADGSKEPDDSITIHNLGSVAYEEEDDEVAIQCFRFANGKNPLSNETKWNIGTTEIRRYCDGIEGVNLLKAWFYYDNRFRLYDLNAAHENLELWDFYSEHQLDGVVVLRDQGRGDTLMFARYLSELEKYFGRVYVQSDPYMETLFKYEPYRTDSAVKYAVPMCSLGKLLDHIPAGDWLADRNIVVEKSDKLRVACVWDGTADHVNNKNRNCSASYFDRLTGIEKYTIGPGVKREGYIHLDGLSWDDTIANLGRVDLVITVDTAIAHLCGCLGKECWVLMPLTYSDYRWGTSKSGSKNAWYSSVQVIRNPRSWDKVFSEVQERINERT